MSYYDTEYRNAIKSRAGKGKQENLEILTREQQVERLAAQLSLPEAMRVLKIVCAREDSKRLQGSTAVAAVEPEIMLPSFCTARIDWRAEGRGLEMKQTA